ncbi:cupin domain-containing protein [Aliidiomarina indica]|uniref:cupin domain-containing protein n=1 Tax=Aliidiomarina indica TaxID=2749147 RepID=UPI001E3BF193|nr:cupin domain-containing protein [Aliidiomarina indica]
MKPSISSVAIALLMLAFTSYANDHHENSGNDAQHHITFTTESVQWLEGPASLEQGAKYAVLEGDPSQTGIFTMRLKLPDGFIIAPHWHPNVERVTVLSGTFKLGQGDTIDTESTHAFTAGSYISMPPEMRHYAIAEGQTIIQLTSQGPWLIHYIHAGDDPRTRQ